MKVYMFIKFLKTPLLPQNSLAVQIGQFFRPNIKTLLHKMEKGFKN